MDPKGTPQDVRARALNAAGRLAWDQGDHQNGEIYSRGALALYREMGDEVGSAWALTWLSAHALVTPGECEEGIRLCEEGLVLFLEAENTRCIPHVLAMSAGPVASQGNPQKAARCLGASEALLAIMGLGLQTIDQFEIERYVAAVKEQIDEATFEAAWAEGRAMSLEEAVSLVLGEGAR